MLEYHPTVLSPKKFFFPQDETILEYTFDGKVSAKREALLAGANSLMINSTPECYKKLYKIYDDKADVTKEIRKNIEETVKMLYDLDLGRAPIDIGR